MQGRVTPLRRTFSSEHGMTLLELIIALSLLLVLASAALPVFRYTAVRHKEFELRRDLREMRDAIDRYKDYSDRGKHPAVHQTTALVVLASFGFERRGFRT